MNRQDVSRTTWRGGPSSIERAVRLTHEPTGITVEVSDYLSIRKNEENAWQLLEEKIHEKDQGHS